MNDTIPLQIRPDVEQFVAAVRQHFADLPSEEVEDLLSGLEADVSDWVAEEGPQVLGDPEVYATELRAAAGLPAYQPTRSSRDLSPKALLDASATGWARLLDALPGDFGAVLRSARPAWWVLRAWVAVMLVSSRIWDVWQQDVPYLPTPSAGLGAALVAIAAVVSIQLGRGKFWPGTKGTAARVVLLGLNAFAIAMTPQVVQSVEYTAQSQYERMTDDTYGQNALISPGYGEVCNLQPYDSSGQPLYGVQLFTEDGQPLNVNCCWEQHAAWQLGDVARRNVFPQAEMVGAGDRRFAKLRRLTVPAVTAPRGVEVPEGTAMQSEEKKAQRKAQKKAQKKVQRKQS